MKERTTRRDNKKERNQCPVYVKKEDKKENTKERMNIKNYKKGGRKGRV